MSDNTNKGFPSVAQQSRIPCPGDDGEEQPPLPLPLPPAQELTVCQLKEEKKRKNREYQQKSRAKKGWQEIEKRANDGILFEAIQIEFITNEPKEVLDILSIPCHNDIREPLIVLGTCR